jgi:pimeloyl-ACP methyl ester carboxylesterase
MIKKLLIILLFGWVVGCAHTLAVSQEFAYTEIKTAAFTLASWQKITDKNAPYKIYIEGDGYAFNSRGQPTNNPTPKGTLVRELAFGDKSPNVVYLARPCQYVKSGICAQRHWTTARFAPEIINSEYEAVKQIAGNNEVVLVGFSGGAQVAGLIAVLKPDIKVKKLLLSPEI